LLNEFFDSGEGAGWESVQDSIQFCGAHRLGHGVRLIENEALLKHVVDRGIAIEVVSLSKHKKLHTFSLSLFTIYFLNFVYQDASFI
jgi:adenosine deaminase